MTPEPKPEPVKSARWRSYMAAIWVNGDECVGLALHGQCADQIADAHNAAVEALEREVERLKGLLGRALLHVVASYEEAYCQEYKALASEIRAEIGGDNERSFLK